MTSILCIAHFCEIHGPTPLMVTQGFPTKCYSCEEREDHADDMADLAEASFASSSAHAGSSAQDAATAAVAEAIHKMNLGSDTGYLSPQKEPRRRRPEQESGSHFRKTYDDSVTRRALPCQNCAMTLPQQTQGKTKSRGSGAHSTQGSQGSKASQGSQASDMRNPTLRTRVPCERVYDDVPLAGDVSPLILEPSSFSASSCISSETEDDDTRSNHYHHRRAGTAASVSTSRSSTSSAASGLTNSHTHYLEYTSTHEPTGPDAYYVIRASCLRTFTLESLPRTGAHSTTSPSALSGPGGSAYFSQHAPLSPSLPYGAPFPHTSPGSGAAATYGTPLFFGDSSVGYTTAHVFRVPDMHARGHKRVYALIALTTQRERLAMKTFGVVSAAFNELAAWIQQLAEAEAERESMHSETTTLSSGATSPSLGTDIGGSAGFAMGGTPHVSPPVTQPSSYATDNENSFILAAGHGLSRRMGPGYAGISGLATSTLAALRARGLPDILGMPDFFVELHKRFVEILLELNTLSP